MRYAIAGFGTADYHAAETIREYDATGKIMAYGDTGRAAAKAGLETDDRLVSGHRGGAQTLLYVLAIAKCAVRLVSHPVSPRLTLFCWPSTFGLREESYWEVLTSRQKEIGICGKKHPESVGAALPDNVAAHRAILGETGGVSGERVDRFP